MTLIEELEQAATDAETLVGHLYSRGFVEEMRRVRDRAASLRARIEHVKRLLANLEARTVTGSVQASVELGLANNLVGDLDPGSAPTKGER